MNKISASARRKILKDHKEWISTDKEEGGRAHLNDADLNKADLNSVNLGGADLRRAHLSDADLWFADLRRADLRCAHLKKADMSDAKLSCANLSGADLRDVNLGNSDLRHANLRKSNLRKTNLRDADLRGADLSGADLEGVSDLNIEQLSKVNTLSKAKLDTELMKQVKEEYSHLFASCSAVTKTAKTAVKLWTKAELSTLKKEYPKTDTQKLAKKMKRTLEAVRFQAKKHGLKKTKSYMQSLYDHYADK